MRHCPFCCFTACWVFTLTPPMLLPSQPPREKKKGPGRDISRLLNRMLGVHVDKQLKIFSYFMLLLVGESEEGGYQMPHSPPTPQPVSHISIYA